MVGWIVFLCYAVLCSALFFVFYMWCVCVFVYMWQSMAKNSMHFVLKSKHTDGENEWERKRKTRKISRRVKYFYYHPILLSYLFWALLLWFIYLMPSSLCIRQRSFWTLTQITANKSNAKENGKTNTFIQLQRELKKVQKKVQHISINT